MAGDRVATLACPTRYDLARTMAHVQLGAWDPTMRIVAGVAWRATRSPAGPAMFRVGRIDDALRVDAWGPGTGWVIDNAPALLGLLDRPHEFQPDHAVLGPLARRHAGVHWPRSLRVMERLVPTVFGQLVTWRETMRSVMRLTDVHGEVAPGPPGLRLMPSPSTLAQLPEYAYAPLGALAKHARAIIEACRVASRLEAAVDLPYDEGMALLQKVRGIGPWTAAITLGVATGNPDAVPVGDLHLPSLVTWALAGEREGTDARMLELLEPFAGQRARVIRLLGEGKLGPPRRGPRPGMRPIHR